MLVLIVLLQNLKEIEKSNIINKVAFIEIDILIFEKIVSIIFHDFFSAYKLVEMFPDIVFYLKILVSICQQK